MQPTLQKVLSNTIIGAVELVFGGSAANAPRLKGDQTYRRQPLHEQALNIAVRKLPLPVAKPMARDLGLAFPKAPTALQAAIKKGAPELKLAVKEGSPAALKALKATIKKGAPAALKTAAHKGAPIALQKAIKGLVSLAVGKMSPPAKPNAAPVNRNRVAP